MTYKKLGLGFLASFVFPFKIKISYRANIAVCVAYMLYMSVVYDCAVCELYVSCMCAVCELNVYCMCAVCVVLQVYVLCICCVYVVYILFYVLCM